MSKIIRRKSREISLGNVKIGGNSKITIQSMTNTDTRDVKATLNQIKELEKAGCEIIRVAVIDEEAANALKIIVKESSIPVVADIHFDYKLALESIDNGVSGLRINPGNIGNSDKVRMLVRKCKEKNIPIRIGVNSGSVEKDILEKYSGVTAKGMVESALRHVKILEDENFKEMKISIKSSDVNMMIESYRLIKDECDYPLHIGVTEAGVLFSGTIKSAIGIGTLLSEGIGDTIRVSLTGNPIEEINVAKEILKTLDLREKGIEIISCPTCGRTQIGLIEIANEVVLRTKNINKNIKIAVMGCAVNGPGEAREADIGIAGGNGTGLIFKKGIIIKKVKEEELVEALLKEIDNI